MTTQSEKCICKVCKTDNSEHDNNRCTNCNRLLKGRKSINPNGPKGDPNKPKPKTWQSEKPKLIKALGEGDVQAVTAILLDFAETAKDARMIVKEMMPYISPKLQSTASVTKQDNTLEITWTAPKGVLPEQGQGVAKLASDNAIVIDNNPTESIG